MALVFAVIVYGYLVEIFRSSQSPDPKLPPLSGFGSLLVDGLVSVVVWLAYSIPSMVALGTIGIWLFLDEPNEFTTTMALLFAAALVVSLCFILVAYYLAPAALANYARVGTFRSAFDLPTITKTAFTQDYLVGWGFAVVVSLGLGSIAGLLQLILVGFILHFYMLIVMTSLCGRGYASAYEAV